MGDTLLIQQRGFRFDAASKTINGALEFMQIRDGTRSLYFAEPLIRSHSPISPGQEFQLLQFRVRSCLLLLFFRFGEGKNRFRIGKRYVRIV